MKLNYEITPADFVAFNIYFAEHDPVLSKQTAKLRVTASMMVVGFGLLLMFITGGLRPVSVAVYVVLAALTYLLFPRYYRYLLKRNVDRTLRAAANRAVCGPKTLTLDDENVSLTGENESSVYPYSGFHKLCEDEGHYYLFLDDVSALILPFTAFADEAAKQAFYAFFTEKTQIGAGENGEKTVDNA